MADARSIVSTILFYLWWPTDKLLRAISAILSPFLRVAQFVLLPVTYLIHAILNVLLLPFRLQILERFETIYIWLGIAGLIGCLTGGLLFLIFKILSSAMNIDAAAETNARVKGPTAKDYRAARRRKIESSTESYSSPSMLSVPVPRRRGLSSQVIMEEESEF